MTEFLAAREVAHVAGSTAPRSTELVDLAAATGRTLAADLIATAPLPGFAAAAMDGWAVAGDGPWMVGDAIKACDDIPVERLQPGAARPISTGAPLPSGVARVIRSERGEVHGSTLAEVVPDSGLHVRETGEEAARGEVLIQSGVRLSPPRIALAAAAGYDALSVITPPTVRLLVLGDEVIDRGSPVPGRVRDVFSPSFPALLGELGVLTLGRVGDSLDDTTAAFGAIADPLLVTTGGSARGPADHVRSSLTSLGAEMLLDGIRMRPGHPLMLARLPSGTLVLSLPGNPLAAYVGLVAIGGALLDGMLARPLAPLARTTLAEAVPGGPATRIVAASRTPAGAVPTGHQGAGMLRGLAAADLLAVITPSGAAAGDRVEYLPLPW
ncbi:MAG: molybdopterin molybdotransferase MoeA [Pseudolysinimonas sp.]